jgi:hypothetical protein
MKNIKKFYVIAAILCGVRGACAVQHWPGVLYSSYMQCAQAGLNSRSSQSPQADVEHQEIELQDVRVESPTFKSVPVMSDAELQFLPSPESIRQAQLDEQERYFRQKICAATRVVFCCVGLGAGALIKFFATLF